MICIITGQSKHFQTHEELYNIWLIQDNYVYHEEHQSVKKFLYDEENEEFSCDEEFHFQFLNYEKCDYKKIKPHRVQMKDWRHNLRQNQEANDLIESLLQGYRGELPNKDGKAYLQGLARLGLNISKMTAVFNYVTNRISIHQGVGTRGLTLEDVIRLVDFQPTVQ